MLTKDLKKGTMVQLNNGWKAKVIGSARGHTTLCEVYGFCTEMGSVYTTDIVGYWEADGTYKSDIELTESQKKAKKMRSSFGF